ncbi:tetratricopeptide repeat (TPR)-containing protein [Arabidopsis thaliana]|uniref:Clustered mitochondria protein n=1 Tax=Arabidopsis thaliana TaxID=3702 RepID=CLU_ARATH|nr:tetratricopeptide repeat (TPR)-containing protein [Arabidopsis thaliana]F4J5S1.1 RecName: Full=Clustered mitochondria protein; AltName: Full=Friendly mitochondria protein [Arabidopsis thaliana]AEE78900.1 tetratricopeptide repeat (TPR)-containing protein [Arabidopsis thaliana]|eukprot:NP_001190066.1 tetratricopeptide repeat (TPR)-containing protein [Arabidopsis thaliana]
MAGKSNKSKAKRAAQSTTTNSTTDVKSDAPAPPVAATVPATAPVTAAAAPVATAAAPVTAPDNGTLTAVDSAVPEANEVAPTIPKADESESQVENNDAQPKQGELRLYPVSVKTQSGGKMELQLNPGDSVMDIRQFLLDAPETCYFTCYELLLRNKDGETHHLEDYNEISEVADITIGGCSLEMVAALYDDRSIRAHVHRARDLLSLSTLHSSLSTTLALQYDAALNKVQNPGDKPKSDVPELECLGFMEDVPGSLKKLINSTSEEIRSVENIVFSSFNPPPSHRRLVGDLIYLDVVTLEGNKYCITGTTKTFYVNSSSGNILDPRPSKSGFEAATLIGLLQKLSSKFKKAFREVMEKKASAHPFENVQSLLPPHSWLRTYPVPDHKRDAARAEEALTISYGSELIGMQRDWNEELQSCREFPHTSPQERILRDRALYKVSSDFVDAALNGAIGVISRCIPPINPTDPECLHMYVHNNIFFSFAVDADIEQLSKKRPSNQMTEKVSSSEKVSCTEGTCDNEEHNNCNEAPLVENEQATYASANNDLKGTKLYQEADVPGLYNLAMAIIDYRGHRVVAQSVLPGILQGDKSDALLYGSVDNGKKICWNEDFHAKVLEAAKLLHIKEHSVIDASETVFKLAAPVECKGIVGSDNRHYLLDLMRVTPRDANYTGPESRFCVLRPELITSFCQAESLEKSKFKTKADEGGDDSSNVSADTSKVGDALIDGEANGASNSDQKSISDKQNTTAEDYAAGSSESSKSCDQIAFNPNVFTDFTLGGNQEEIAADEENVKKVSSYLVDVVLPKFIEDLCTLEVSPMDGQTLTEALHAHGVNVRYIGRVANGVKHLPHLWDLCLNEITVRSAKHILKDILRDIEDHDIGSAVSHFLNCFFGNYQTAGGKASANSSTAKNQKKFFGADQPITKKGQGRGKGKASSKKSFSSYMMVDSNILWSDIQEFAKAKYEFELPELSRTTAKKVSVLRNLCQKVGVSIAARKYDFSANTPFETSDILDLRPVIKHSVPVCSEAKDLVEMGKVQLAEGMLSESYTFFSEAFSILQQVTGPMHREVANCCRYLAMVLYHAGDMAGAIMQQHKELIINERCLGLDHPDTAHSYGNMALFYHGLNQTELALQNMGRALLLLGLSSGPDHPDVAATFINVAMMYQDMGKMDTALRYLQEALKKNERLLGPEHIQTAVCYHALAIAFNCMGAFKLSHQHEKKTYDILVKQLGDDDSRTRDSLNWMKTFKMRELQMTAQKQKGQAANAANTQKAIDLLKAHPDLIHAFQNAAATGRTNALNSAVLGETQPRGRGFDERAARAAAEVRKKAAAKGLLVRPQGGVPVQAMPPLSQLQNMINTATVSSEKGGENGEAKVQEKKESSENGKTENLAPAGLGAGLTSLDKKKQKAKK